MTNEVRCGCEDRFICARCIIDHRDGVMELRNVAEDRLKALQRWVNEL
jgi:hypothetical protein